MTNELVDSGASFSGLERDHLFVNIGGKSFVELSGVSGLDSLGDARTHVRLDYDRDGFSDIAIMNANAPQLKVYHNRLSSSLANQFMAIRIHGGNRTGIATSKWSNRDGVGAQIRVQLGQRTLLREHRAGEGFAGQNSKTLIVGLGKYDHADSVQVHWPSGRKQSIQNVPAGTLLDVYEDPAELGGCSFVQQKRYYIDGNARKLAPRPFFERIPLQVNTKAQLSVYVTVASWCRNCQHELNQLRERLQRLTPGTVAAFGVPIDPNDTQQELERWQAEHQLPMPVLVDLTEQQRQRIRSILRLRATSPQSVPNTIITDQRGVVRAVFPGAPTLSQLRALLDS